MFEGSFDHPWTPYFSKSEQQYTDGCDTCGWNKRIHPPKPISHITCDQCGVVTPRSEAVVQVLDVLIPSRSFSVPHPDERLEPLEITLPSNWQPYEHYFCSDRCLEDRMFVLP